MDRNLDLNNSRLVAFRFCEKFMVFGECLFLRWGLTLLREKETRIGYVVGFVLGWDTLNENPWW